MRTSFHHQSEAQPPNGPLTAATSPDTPSAAQQASPVSNVSHMKVHCRRQIEKSPLAPIEMSLSPVFESDGELAADDGDFDEPFGDRSDERFARSGRGADQGF